MGTAERAEAQRDGVNNSETTPKHTHCRPKTMTQPHGYKYQHHEHLETSGAVDRGDRGRER